MLNRTLYFNPCIELKMYLDEHLTIFMKMRVVSLPIRTATMGK